MWHGKGNIYGWTGNVDRKVTWIKAFFREQTSSAVTTRDILLETQSFLVQRGISGANLFLKRRDDATSVRVKKLAISWAGYEITKASNGPTESSRLAPDITELRGQFDWNDKVSLLSS